MRALVATLYICRLGAFGPTAQIRALRSAMAGDVARPVDKVRAPSEVEPWRWSAGAGWREVAR